MAFKRIVALVPWLLATLASTFGALHPAPETAPGDFFYNITDNTGADSPGTRNLCRENGWLNYDTTSGYRVAANTITRTNAELVQEVANRAARKSFEGSAHVQGTLRHGYADRLLNRYQSMFSDRGLSTEVRYMNGVPDVGGKGAIRLDVVEGDLFSPTSVFDYKFGTSGLTHPRINQIRRVGGFGENVPILEIRPTP